MRIKQIVYYNKPLPLRHEQSRDSNNEAKSFKRVPRLSLKQTFLIS